LQYYNQIKNVIFAYFCKINNILLTRFLSCTSNMLSITSDSLPYNVHNLEQFWSTAAVWCDVCRLVTLFVTQTNLLTVTAVFKQLRFWRILCEAQNIIAHSRQSSRASDTRIFYFHNSLIILNIIVKKTVIEILKQSLIRAKNYLLIIWNKYSLTPQNSSLQFTVKASLP
jgi:hypothetical protein